MVAEGLWIFGYGSLVWRPDFAHRARRPAWIRGFERRFWQGSTDHRGVPGAPGRVVTLVRKPEARCWGMAYAVAPNAVDEVLGRLDQREQGGYERLEVDLHFGSGDAFGRAVSRCKGLLYLATPGNPNYLGPAPLERIALQVQRSAGPSGHNSEYVMQLAAALIAMRPELTAESEEVLALAGLLREQAEARTPDAT